MDHGKNIRRFLRTTEKRELNICTAHKLASPKIFTWEHILFLLCKQPSWNTKEDFRRSVQHTKKLSVGHRFQKYVEIALLVVHTGRKTQ